MCLILFAHDVHPDYSLVVAANRDEFYARPTRMAGFWPEYPQLLAGQDSQAGGTWLGITRAGRFAAITNFREGESSDARHSRGRLPLDFLLSERSAPAYLGEVEQQAAQFRGFNLVIGDPGELYYFGNRAGAPQQLDAGVHVLGNGVLNDNWHKLHKARQDLHHLLKHRVEAERLLRLMMDETRPGDSELPDTGVGLELERLLSARFIRSLRYGTRAITVILVGRNGNVRFLEQNFGREGQQGALKDFSFGLKNVKE